ncbi:MAG: FKBP-type peptidylprolyl isomerase [Eubacteriales bacterium]|nr:FKBP-type peptidylprolyl isomerase [Eubacteriales bacterium]
MKELTKRTAAAALAGVLAAGMLAGCGGKKLDGTKTVATVNGTEIPMGVVSLYARQQQAQTAALYMQFMGSADNIWNQTADSESGETYGDQAVRQSLEQVQLMCIMKEKAADYGVEVTEEEESAMAEAAKAFMEANDEETLEALAVTEDQVRMLLELETYREKIHEPILEEADIQLTDEEIQQSSFTYVSISTAGENLTEEDIKKKKEQAQKILDQMLEDPKADMDEIAKAEDEGYSALTGSFTTNETEDQDLQTTAYAQEVLEALHTLKEGEVYPEVVETETGEYVLRLDEEFDQDATESKRSSVTTTKENAYYAETTEKWLEEADVTTDEKALKKLTITDQHMFTFKEKEAPETENEDEDSDEAQDAEELEAIEAEDAEAEDAKEEEAETEEAETEDAEAEEDKESGGPEDTETDEEKSSSTSTDVQVEEEPEE